MGDGTAAREAARAADSAEAARAADSAGWFGLPSLVCGLGLMARGRAGQMHARWEMAGDGGRWREMTNLEVDGTRASFRIATAMSALPLAELAWA